MCTIIAPAWPFVLPIFFNDAVAPGASVIFTLSPEANGPNGPEPALSVTKISTSMS